MAGASIETTLPRLSTHRLRDVKDPHARDLFTQQRVAASAELFFLDGLLDDERRKIRLNAWLEAAPVSGPVAATSHSGGRGRRDADALRRQTRASMSG